MAAHGPSAVAAARELFQTKYGHFREDGQAFIITRPDTPRPWINVLSNGTYGLLISQAGGGFSWWENANLARLTSWTQDLVRDESGKFLYLRDEESGEVWSASYKPVGAAYDHYEVHHAIGATTFIQRRAGIETRWTLVVPPNDSMEIWLLELKNLGERPRRLSVFSYLEWCLGNGLDWHREFQKTFIETRYDPRLQAVIGVKHRLPIPPHISSGMTEWALSGFHAVNREVVSYEGDKEQFLGRLGTLQAPASVQRGRLSKMVGRWNDSIASLQVQVALEPGQSDEVVFLLGKHDSLEAAETMIRTHGSPQAARQALLDIQHFWEPFLKRPRVETPDPAFDLMTNIWLKYQTIGGRLWARTAFYQSSAAYGYRDQLQDSHVFLPINPELTKQQILLHARHQFKDGGVQHWWLTLVEIGPRSGHSDTPLWLVYLTLSYLTETDDLTILKEQAPFLDGSAATLFAHCARAIEKVLANLSRRGFPLILHGDWNDGLSAVGPLGKGESLWMGQFLYDILQRWSGVCDRLRTDSKVKMPGVTGAKLAAIARRYRARAAAVKRAINTHGWDGKWYWAATRDDGRLLGSQQNTEGRIFLNAQTWGVITGTSTPERIKVSMASVEKLLDREYGPLLLTPAYTQPDDTIGYLSRYAPGVRENGGVYSHGAVWAILAECLLGRGDVAYAMYSKICPPKRGMDPDLYCAEPYVMPGNTDGPESPFFGRAGWTWYTGSAAWLFRVGTEWILGVRPTGEGLLVEPCIPSAWDGFRIIRQFRSTTYQIIVENPNHVCTGVKSVWLDGRPHEGNLLPDLRDGQVHQVRAIMGKGVKKPSA